MIEIITVRRKYAKITDDQFKIKILTFYKMQQFFVQRLDV